MSHGRVCYLYSNELYTNRVEREYVRTSAPPPPPPPPQRTEHQQLELSTRKHGHRR